MNEHEKKLRMEVDTSNEKGKGSGLCSDVTIRCGAKRGKLEAHLYVKMKLTLWG